MRGRKYIRRLVLISAAGFFALAMPVAEPFAKPGFQGFSANAGDLCRRATAIRERAAGIPRKLLYAISVVETGRWNEARQERLAWPWSVRAEGRGRYLPTKQAAIREVRQLQRRGVKNIDVGCMQVNLHFHRAAFASLEEAFDPAANVAYAAGFLKDLHRKRRSWAEAVKHYHSATEKLNAPYRDKVYQAWRTEKKKTWASLRTKRNTKLASRGNPRYRTRGTKVRRKRAKASTALAARQRFSRFQAAASRWTQTPKQKTTRARRPGVQSPATQSPRVRPRALKARRIARSSSPFKLAAAARRQFATAQLLNARTRRNAQTQRNAVSLARAWAVTRKTDPTK